MCEEEIPEKRLLANPKTVLCLSCQEKRESKGGFIRSYMEIKPEIESWNNVGVTQNVIKGSE